MTTLHVMTEYGNGKHLRTLAYLLESNRDIPMTAVHTMLVESVPYEQCYED